MSRTKERFRPRHGNEVKIFTCGPSTYRRPHIGNYRSFLYEDLLVRYLTYKGYEVDRTINFTDVEDKTLVEADNKGKTVEEITEEVHRHFFRETELLGILLPKHIPRSSTSVGKAVEIIQKLVKDGHAYWHGGNVYFAPLTFEGFGKLFGLDMSNWPTKPVRFSKDTYNGRRWNRGDFILWHGHQNESPSSTYWDTDIGKGRPAWNIQDPAMIVQQLGNQIDINCGGIDNIYRHHDYNIAVMESYTGKSFARFYMHGEHLIVDSEVMSKTKGNILYPDDLVDRGYEHKHLRFFLIYTHYRNKLNFTNKNFKRSSALLDDFRSLVERITAPGKGGGADAGQVATAKKTIDSIPTVFEQSMDDDLSAGKGFDAVFETLRSLEGGLAGKVLPRAVAKELNKNLGQIDQVLGVLRPD